MECFFLIFKQLLNCCLFSIFLKENFIQRARLTGFYCGHTYTHHVDSVINIFVYLLYFLSFSLLLSLYPFLHSSFFGAFNTSCRNLYTLFKCFSIHIIKAYYLYRGFFSFHTKFAYNEMYKVSIYSLSFNKCIHMCKPSYRF